MKHVSFLSIRFILRVMAFVFIFFFFNLSTGFAVDPPATETAGGLMQQRKMIEDQKKIEKKASEKKTVTEEIIPPEIIPTESGEKVLVKKITVEGVTLILQKEVSDITALYEGKDLSLRDMQKVADLITDIYRKRGFVTSRAYIPPQTMKNSELILRVVEGRMGSLEIKGNRYFKTALLRKKIDLTPNGYFDFLTLQKSLTNINEHPDRQAKAVLVPGKEPGTTDIIIQVKDRLPIHLGGSYDNYSSRYLGEQKWTAFMDHNNFLGFDDKLHLEWQETRDSSLRITQGRYVFPVNPDLDAGMYISRSRSKLGREFELVDSRGKGFVFGVFTNKALIKSDALDLRWNLGFDYKNIDNYLLGSEMSSDEIRIIKTGLDFDFNDPWARNIFTAEFDQGIPHIMGGMKSEDIHSSRGSVGSGGQFQKWLANYFRLQPGPFSSEILWKNSAQFSNNNLVAGEQFQIGGPASVRGYTPAEFAGDTGLYSGIDWAFPPYFVPKSLKVPFTNRTIFDSFRIVTFYDWGHIHINETVGSERANRTLRGCGAGVRLSLGENFSARIEFGYPLSNTEPGNKKNVQPWFELTMKF